MVTDKLFRYFYYRNIISSPRNSPNQMSIAEKHANDYEKIVYKEEYYTCNEESHKGKYITATYATKIKKYFFCTHIWKGLGLMFFYQFAGYNVVSFYATSIIQHPKEVEEVLIHPSKNNKVAADFDTSLNKNEYVLQVIYTHKQYSSDTCGSIFCNNARNLSLTITSGVIQLINTWPIVLSYMKYTITTIISSRLNLQCKIYRKYNLLIFSIYSFEDGVPSIPTFNFHLDPVLSAAVIVATSGLLGVLIGVFLVQKGWNRKRILLFSGFGTAISFLTLGLHFYDNKTGK